MLLTPLAEVLHRLGSRHVLVVRSEDGLDELSVSAASRVAELKMDVYASIESNHKTLSSS